MNALFLTVILSTPVAAYLAARYLRKKPKIVIEDFNQEEAVMEDQPGVQSELEIAAVEYVRNANQETLATLRQAARNFVVSESAPKAAKKSVKPKK